MELPEEYSDPGFLQALSDSDNALNESFETLQRTIYAHEVLQTLLNASDSVSAESFESMARSAMIDVCTGTEIDPALADLSVESVGRMVINAGRAILAALKAFFTRLIDFFSNVDLVATWMLRQVSQLERVTNLSRGKSVEKDTITLGRIHRFLRVGGQFADDSIRLERELKALLEILRTLGGDYLNGVLETASKLPRAANGKTGGALSSALVQLIVSTPFEVVASKCKMVPAAYERFSRNNVLTTGPILGGKSLFFFNQDLGTKGIRGFAFYGFQFTTSGRETPSIAAERNFNTLNPAQVGNIPGILKDILNTISKQANVSSRSRIVRAKAQLENYVKTVQQTPMSGTDIEAIRKTVNTLTYWMQNPIRPLFSNSMSVCRATLAYVSSSVQTYR